MSFDRRQLAVLSLLTLVWGLNWPIMKLGATLFPPLTFRTVSMWMALPVLRGRAARAGRAVRDLRAATGASWPS